MLRMILNKNSGCWDLFYESETVKRFVVGCIKRLECGHFEFCGVYVPIQLQSEIFSMIASLNGWRDSWDMDAVL